MIKKTSRCYFFFFQAADGIRAGHVTGVQTCALPIWVTAAMATLEGRLTGDATCHLEAAGGYARIGNASSRILALVAAARALVAAGDLEHAEPVVAELAAFAARTGAHRLLDGLPAPAPLESA